MGAVLDAVKPIKEYLAAKEAARLAALEAAQNPPGAAMTLAGIWAFPVDGWLEFYPVYAVDGELRRGDRLHCSNVIAPLRRKSGDCSLSAPCQSPILRKTSPVKSVS